MLDNREEKNRKNPREILSGEKTKVGIGLDLAKWEGREEEEGATG